MALSVVGLPRDMLFLLHILYLHYLLLLHSHYLPLRCSFGPAEEDDYFQEHLNTLGFNIKSSYEFEEEGTVGGDDNKGIL